MSSCRRYRDTPGPRVVVVVVVVVAVADMVIF